jgi:hypothetical protein
MSPVDGWLGIVATAELRDRDKLVEVLDRVKGLLADVPHRNQPRIETSKFGNYDLQTLVIRDVPVRLAWCVIESRVIVGVQPQAVKSFMDVKAGEAGLFSEPALASAFQGEGKPIAISYQDSAKVFEQTYGVLTLLAPMLAEGIGDRSRFGGPTPLPQPPLFDVTSLPSSRSVHRHLRPSISVTRRTRAASRRRSGRLPYAQHWRLGAGCRRLAAASRASSENRSSSNSIPEQPEADHAGAA